MPQSHADLVKLLTHEGRQVQGQGHDLRHREVAASASCSITQDSKYNPQFWELVKALGARRLRAVQSSTGTMLERITSGENLIGYNVLGSYALRCARRRTRRSASCCPKDYTLVLSRVMFIVKTAKNPNAAKLWVDYILSKRGQTIIANQSELVLDPHRRRRRDTRRPALTKQLGNNVKPIPVSPRSAGLPRPDQAARLSSSSGRRRSLGRK